MRRPRISLDDAFAMLERAAAAGERCPISSPGGLTSTLTTALAHAGKIRIDIYAKNWRVVTILAGEHLGKSTAACPTAGIKPYLSYVGKFGSRPITLPSTTVPWGRR